MKHMMPINDIEHAWTEERVSATADGVIRYTVYCGRCTCGRLFEGRDSSQVARAYVAHSNKEEGR